LLMQSSQCLSHQLPYVVQQHCTKENKNEC
jgi:hypothetical protein